MNDKFSLYQTDGLWGIIENASDKKQTSIKSYFGSDLIIKRLNEQDQQIDRLKQQLAEKDKEIEDLKKWQDWYSMWHENFKKQIEDLTTELETYRPTKLHGNGQCECYKCKQEGKQPIHWTNWCNEYKGHIYCNDCLKEILKEEQSSQTQLAIKELEKVKDTLKHFCNIHNDEYYGVKSQVKGIEQDVCDQINQQIKELKGEKE